MEWEHIHKTSFIKRGALKKKRRERERENKIRSVGSRFKVELG